MSKNNDESLLESLRKGELFLVSDQSKLASDTNDQNRKLPFLIRRDGKWFYRGEPILRSSLISLFSGMLTRDEKGNYYLETPSERGIIEVEDAPFLIVDIHWDGCGRQQVISLRTNVDQMLCLNNDHPLKVDLTIPFKSGETGAIPYVRVRKGKGKFDIWARLSRAVYYEFALLAERGIYNGKCCYGVWSQNQFFPLGYCGQNGCSW